MDAPEPPALGKPKPGTPVAEHTIFISSANDALDLRERVDGLIHNAINPILRSRKLRIRFEPDMWEKSAPRRLAENETIDDEFVARAVASQLMVTLLYERLGPGTKKEIEAVLASETEISMLWFGELGNKPEGGLGEFLKELEDEEVLRYDTAGEPDSRASWEAIVRVLLAAILDRLSDQREDFRERR